MAGLIQKYSKGKPTIVFCHSKMETERLAELLTHAPRVGLSHGRFDHSLATKTQKPSLQRVLLKGISYHHAGMDAEDRRLIETGFGQGKIRVICATSTLAMGVNLPVHLVIVKGTRAWRGSGSGYQDLDAASLLQMIGRAGRPGFDTSGTALLMTDTNSKSRIERLILGLGRAESQLEHRLAEVLNTEISQYVISNRKTAIDWIKDTLYFFQILKNSSSFGIGIHDGQSIDAYLLQQCDVALTKLQAMKFVSETTQGNIVPKPASHIMSASLVGIQAAELMVGLPFDATMCQVLTALCHIEDLQRSIRRKEKKLLNEAHKIIKYKLDGPPSKVRVQTPFQKSFVLLQGEIAQHYFEDYTLRQETSAMREYSFRMLSALEDYSARGSKNGHVVVQSLKLRRSLAVCLWNENEGLLNQIEGVGQASTGSLRMHGNIHSFDDVLEATPEQIDNAVVDRQKGFGLLLKNAVEKIMNGALKLSASIQNKVVICTLEFRQPTSTRKSSGDHSSADINYTLVCYTDKAESCFYFQNNICNPEEICIPCPAEFGVVVIHLVASMVGLDEKVELLGSGPIQKTSYTANYFTKQQPSSDSLTKTKKQTTIRDVGKKLTAGSAKTTQTHPALFSDLSNPAYLDTVKTSLQKRSRETDMSNNFNAAIIKMQRREKKEPAPVSQPVEDDIVDTAFSYQTSEQQDKRGTTSRCDSSKRRLPPALLPEKSQKNNTQRVYQSPHWPRQRQGQIQQKAPMQQNQLTRPTFTKQQPAALGAGAYRTPPNRFPSGSSWKKDKRQMEAQQRRAYSDSKANPFSQFSHDPNDSEAFLEAVNKENTSIIPPKTLENLQKKRHGRGIAIQKRNYNKASRQRPSGRQLLYQKAQEMQYSTGYHHQPSPQYQPHNHQQQPTETPIGNFNIVTMPIYQQREYEQSWGHAQQRMYGDRGYESPNHPVHTLQHNHQPHPCHDWYTGQDGPYQCVQPQELTCVDEPQWHPQCTWPLQQEAIQQPTNMHHTNDYDDSNDLFFG